MKKLLCAVIAACLLAQVPAGFAEEAALGEAVLETAGETPVPKAEEPPTPATATPAPATATPAPATATPAPATATPAPATATPAPATATPDATASVEPSSSPDATASVEPSESPDPTASVEPSESPDPTASVEPSESPDPTASVEPSESPAPEIPDGAEAWMTVGDAVAFGTLAEMIEAAQPGAEIALRAETPMFVEKAPLRKLSQLKFKIDEQVFSGAEFRVACSEDDPMQVEAPQELDMAQFALAEEDEALDLYFWVVRVDPAATSTPAPTTEPGGEIALAVESENYVADAWTNVPPTFRLSGMPGEGTWSYAVVVYDERIAVLSGDEYEAVEEGEYALRFAILDAVGDVADASESYFIRLDRTPPTVVATVDEAVSYTLNLAVTDALSGVDAVSVDGGAVWLTPQADGTFVYTAPGETTLEPGMVQARDAAGNVWQSAESYTLTAVSSGGDFGFGGGGGGGDFGGGGGGGGSGSAARQHASGDGEEEADYGTLALELPDEPMAELTIGGETLPLSLELAAAEGFEIPDDFQATFTAELTAWTPAEPDGEAEAPEEEAEEKTEEEAEADGEAPAPDTLILAAVEEPNLGDRFEYRWRFNGEVCRLLSNSGVRYLALAVGGDMAVLPTEGFTGGTKYTELRMLGVSTRKFDYAVAMTFNLDPDRIPALSETDFSENCDLAIQTEVEEMKYVLSAEPRGEMYYYGVYVGPRDMIEFPYGEYRAGERAQ